MSREPDDITRRRLLRDAGGGAIAASGLGSDAREWGSELGYNVGYSDGDGRRAAVDAASSVLRRFDHIDAVTVRLPEQAVEALEHHPGVRYVERNGVMEAFQETTPWGIDRVDADVATSDGADGDGADLAVIDTGIDSDHVDGEHALGAGRAFVDCGSGGFFGFGCLFSGNTNDCNEPWDDDNDHGTHVAGSAAAVADDDGVVGVGPGVTLHAAKALDCGGSGSYSDIAAAIEWTGDRGHDVANMSLGSDGSSSTVADAIEYAAGQGVTLVAAAGNSGPCSDCVAFPARHPEVIAISASTCGDGLAEFSSTGPEVELIAPGKDVYSTVPSGYTTFSGTSMAAPHVAGAAAVLAAEGSSRSDIRSSLKSDAEDLGLAENEQGQGLVDVAASVGLDSSDDGTGDGPNC